MSVYTHGVNESAVVECKNWMMSLGVDVFFLLFFLLHFFKWNKTLNKDIEQKNPLFVLLLTSLSKIWHEIFGKSPSTAYFSDTDFSIGSERMKYIWQVFIVAIGQNALEIILFKMGINEKNAVSAFIKTGELESWR